MRVEQFRLAFKYFDVVVIGDNGLILLIAIDSDDFALLGNEFGEVHLHFDGFQPRVARVRRFPDNARRFDEILARQATAIDAGAAQRAHFGHGGGLAQLCGADGGGEGSRARAENHQVETTVPDVILSLYSPQT